MGFLGRIKALARLDASQTEEPSGELGDFIEPGSTQELQASGLIDADTFKMIEASMTNASAQIEQLHASGAMSDEIYAQAMASLAAATSGGGSSVDAAELELLQHGESAAATILTTPEPIAGADARLGMRLEVHPAAGPPYPVDCTIAALHPGGDLKVGDFLRVKVDPKDPGRVAIDWTGFGS